MILAMGVTGFYFNAPGTSHVPQILSIALLFPINLVQIYGGKEILSLVIKNPSMMFLMLWISYSVIAVWLAPLLMVRNHTAEELHKWYKGRYDNR
jgi:hypothetical protein